MDSKQAKEYLELQKARFIKTMAPEMRSSLNEAVSALERQIPQKTNYFDEGYYAECPRCGKNDFEYGINDWECKHCPNCGQTLDWS